VCSTHIHGCSRIRKRRPSSVAAPAHHLVQKMTTNDSTIPHTTALDSPPAFRRYVRPVSPASCAPAARQEGHAYLCGIGAYDAPRISRITSLASKSSIATEQLGSNSPRAPCATARAHGDERGAAQAPSAWRAKHSVLLLFSASPLTDPSTLPACKPVRDTRDGAGVVRGCRHARCVD
jgi:hypothetical protein